MSLAARLKPYAQLVRLPNVFTAAADSFAGWMLAGGAWFAVAAWGPLALASMAIYAAGIVLNDLFDLEIDRAERPNRPLPSGRVSIATARFLGFGLLIAGPLLAAMSGSTVSVGVAVALAACVLAYDGGMKRTVLGPTVMGACRGLNVLLGMSALPDGITPAGVLVAAALLVYIMGITWVSRSEVSTGRSSGVVAGIGLENAALVTLFAVGWLGAFPASVVTIPQPILGALALLGAVLVLNRANLRALHKPIPKTRQAAVKAGILTLIWLHVGLLLMVRGIMPASAVALLWIPAFFLGRWVYST